MINTLLYPEDTVYIPLLNGITRYIGHEDVRYVEANGDYVRFSTIWGTSLLTRLKLNLLEQAWKPVGFIRIHRTYLVCLYRINELRLTRSGTTTVRVGLGPEAAELPVSRRRVHDLKEHLSRMTIRIGGLTSE